MSPAGFDMKVRIDNLFILIWNIWFNRVLALHSIPKCKVQDIHNTPRYMSVYIFEELSKKVNIYVLGTLGSGSEIERRDCLLPWFWLLAIIYQVKLEAIFFDYYIVLGKETKSSCAPFLLQYNNLSCPLLLWFKESIGLDTFTTCKGLNDHLTHNMYIVNWAILHQKVAKSID